MVRLHSSVQRRRYTQTRIGWWAWLFQRVSGLALVGYLFLHIAVISTALGGADTFDSVLKMLQRPIFVVLDLGLVATVLYHSLNGLRVVLFDVGLGIRQQAALFWACVVVTGATMAVATYFSLPLILR